MSSENKKASAVGSVVSLLRALALGLAVLVASPRVFAVDSGDIVVVSVKGEVHFVQRGADRKLSAGSRLELPATLSTGRDGAVELKQGATTLSVGPETTLEFPALAARGGPIDRIVQPRGNAFYSIGKREGRKLRVETPYLVGVIKGTQFNVAVGGDATTISLFEGLLEVQSTDGNAAIDLHAGEIATRKNDDKSIGVIKMDAGRPSPVAPRAPAGSSDRSVRPPRNAGEQVLVDRGDRVPDATPDLSGDVVANVAGVTDLVTGPAVGAGAGQAEMATVASEVTASTGVDTGPIAADVNTSASVDTNTGTADVSSAGSVAAGPISVDVVAAPSVDLGPAVQLETSASVAVDAGPLTTDVSASAAVDAGAGTVAATVDVGTAAPVVQVNVDANVAANVVAGTVDVGADVAGVDLNAGVDLGLGTSDNSGPGNSTDGSGSDNSGPGSDSSGSGSDNSGPGNTNLGEILNGLLRQTRKK